MIISSLQLMPMFKWFINIMAEKNKTEKSQKEIEIERLKYSYDKTLEIFKREARTPCGLATGMNHPQK